MNASLLQKTVLPLTLAQIKSRYRNTILGIFWVLANPLIGLLVNTLVFKYILNINLNNYLLFLISGLLPWFFITSSLNITTNLFISSGDLLKAMQLHPFSYYLSHILDNFFNFTISFLAALLLATFYYDINWIRISLGIFQACVLLVSVTSLGYLLATLQVYLRDTVYLTQFITGIMFLLTPIVYSMDFIPKEWQVFQKFNIFWIMISPFQSFLWQEGSIDFGPLLRHMVASLILTLLATLFWRARRASFYYLI